jgi:hypothetical protein
MRRLLPIPLVMLLGGCVGSMPTPTPMHTLEYAAPVAPARCLFVMLPGFGDHAETFAEKGFIEELRSRSLSVDVRTTDANFGYYMKGSFLERLSTDVIAPAKAHGYQEIWLTGPSMGGFGSLFYSRAHTAEITGVLAIAPFLGDRGLIKEITAAGGLKTWTAPARVEPMNPDNYQREMWRWFQSVTQGKEPAPLLFLGLGRSDKLEPADKLLAAELPPSHVFLTDGKHEWGAWRRVLQSFLDSPEFAAHCRP